MFLNKRVLVFFVTNELTKDLLYNHLLFSFRLDTISLDGFDNLVRLASDKLFSVINPLSGGELSDFFRGEFGVNKPYNSFIPKPMFVFSCLTNYIGLLQDESISEIKESLGDLAGSFFSERNQWNDDAVLYLTVYKFVSHFLDYDLSDLKNYIYGRVDRIISDYSKNIINTD